MSNIHFNLKAPCFFEMITVYLQMYMLSKNVIARYEAIANHTRQNLLPCDCFVPRNNVVESTLLKKVI
ncbi:hypothetical protein HYN43_014615 [Mucilaginibacter celer]|uniref:Uncharacterized protein n=1 Tax=Mucilaginibacter celer TaxID=2305508 RepID=A0A494VP20_9SPHI|nr:hypothetical protein HYN43_014615 [Mucilaginibacter celer]